MNWFRLAWLSLAQIISVAQLCQACLWSDPVQMKLYLTPLGDAQLKLTQPGLVWLGLAHLRFPAPGWVPDGLATSGTVLVFFSENPY